MDNEAEMVVRVNLPYGGLRPDVEVSAVDATLDIRVGGETEPAVERTYPLPPECGECGIRMTIRRGVLEVRVPVAGVA